MANGIGVDIVWQKRMKKVLENSGEVFIKKVFTPAEQKRANEHSNPISRYSMIFAAKEAIFKAFQLSWDTGVSMTEMEITEGENGEPLATLSGRFAEVAIERQIIHVHLSLSYDGEYAIATVII